MYQKRTNKRNSEDAVSPVVGVMLMLVVTIIIAAVV
ncbi:MAG TPA: type IV pilin, partial [Methanocorpusculum sp.]|nr:type IV pilin [Methanocorpusculum sp.]